MIIKNLTKEIEKYNLIFFNTINKGSIKINELTILLSGKKKFINKDINEIIIIPKIRFVEYSKKFGSLFLVKSDPIDVNMIVPIKE